ncbi:hypothetical protein NLX86_16710 [Streptomyces sp. A3M-1-3]|uniref:hypothetical protein n=1 Tax=Streptomyces sp. A3M-1-3 TaxID=2962044 RepID=UPI0020B8A172|nr:hypothetical protein [Streptomyces sp. A3M-1-3]MCP3819679.1 hypothetical protein [Streptomyces sp. A3M-1-3]
MEDERPALADGEIPAAPPTPPIKIVLYDDQELFGRLHRRWQANTGAWMYRVSVTLWAAVQLGSRQVSEPSDVEFDVPSTHVRPVDGVDYRDVPMRRHREAVIRARTGRRQRGN